MDKKGDYSPIPDSGIFTSNKNGIANMRYMLLSLLALFSLTVSAENEGCDIRLYISDNDPSGTNIRKSPKGAVLITLPLAKETFHGLHATEFKDGWWKVGQISHELGSEISINKGWLHNSVVETGLDDGEIVDDGLGKMRLNTPIYSQPSYKSKTGKFMKYDGKTEILGCSKMWLKIKHTYQGSSITGWWAPEDQCANPVSNCANGSSGENTGTDIWGNN